MADGAPRNFQRRRVIVGEMVGDSRRSRMHVAAAEFFGSDDFARGRFDQRRAGKKYRALIFDDDGFVRHCRHVGAARSAGTHHYRDLRNAQRRHVGLVVENAAEVIAIRKNFVLARQMRAARIDEVNARQAVGLRDFLRTQMLLTVSGK